MFGHPVRITCPTVSESATVPEQDLDRMSMPSPRTGSSRFLAS